jgi:hypothetical protein
MLAIIAVFLMILVLANERATFILYKLLWGAWQVIKWALIILVPIVVWIVAINT